MRSDGITQLVSAIADADAATLDRAEIDERYRALRRVKGWIETEMMACTRRLNELTTPVGPDPDDGVGAGAEVAAALTGEAGQSNSEAAATKDRTELCDRNTELEDSLATGQLTASHLDVIAKARKRLTTDIEQLDFDARMDEIHAWAIDNSVGYLEYRLRSLVNSIRHQHRDLTEAEELARQRNDSELKEFVDRLTGMHKFSITTDPVRAAKIRSAYRAELAALRNNKQVTRESWASLQVEAFVNAMSRGQAAARSSEVIVLIDHQTLTTGQVTEHSIRESVDGTELPVSFIEQLCCDALITFAQLDERGNIHNTSKERTATPDQRRALAAMYRTCAFPGCTMPISDTRAHHVIFRRNNGETKLDNLLPLCESHHHSIHDHRWQVTLDPDTRIATFTSPTGMIHRTEPDRWRQPERTGHDIRESCDRPAPERVAERRQQPERRQPQGDFAATARRERDRTPRPMNIPTGFVQPRLC